MNQGDVYWYTFRAPDKRRTVLILTRNSVIPFLNCVTVAPKISGNLFTPARAEIFSNRLTEYILYKLTS